MLVNDGDAVIGRSIAYYGEYFESEVEVFRHVLAPGSVAVDAGANIGTHALALARLVGPSGRVLAFEPQRALFQMLCASMALNDIGWADCHWTALTAEPCVLHLSELDLSRPGNHGGEALVEAETEDGRPVAGVPLDDVFAEDRLDLVKVDVEGMEIAVLLGAEGVIRRFQPVLYVENDRLDRSSTLIELLAGWGYGCHWHLAPFHNPGNANGRTKPLHPCGFTDQGDRLGSIGFAVNMLCLPPGRPAPEGRELVPVAAATEHPYRRDCIARFGPMVEALRR
jgi:FkbM family methyltransferase